MEAASVPELLKLGAEGVLLTAVIYLWLLIQKLQKELREAEVSRIAEGKKCAEDRLADSTRVQENLNKMWGGLNDNQQRWFEKWDAEAKVREQAVLDCCEKVTVALTKTAQSRFKGG